MVGCHAAMINTMHGLSHIEADKLHFLAIIPVMGDAVRPAFWRIGEKRLLDMATENAYDVDQIEQIIVVSDKPGIFENTQKLPRTLLIESSSPKPLSDCPYPEQLPFVVKVIDRLCRISGKDPCCEGLIILDPLCPLRKSSHITKAMQIYASQSKVERPWQRVASFSLLPNHFHPKKILKHTGYGDLEYFDLSGQQVYRRQQIEGDNYYYINSAIYILDPMRVHRTLTENNEILGLIIDEPIVTVKERHHLEFARALHDHNKRDRFHVDDC